MHAGLRAGVVVLNGAYVSDNIHTNMEVLGCRSYPVCNREHRVDRLGELRDRRIQER